MDSFRLHSKRGVFLVSVLLFRFSASQTLLAAAKPEAIGTQLPEVGTSVLRVFGALLLVFAILLGGVWLFKNFQRFQRPSGKAAQLKIVEVKPLGHRQHVFVLGYQEKRLLVASSPTGVTFLTELPDDVPSFLPPDPPLPPGFSQALQQWTSRS